MRKVLGVCLVGLLALALVAPPAGAITASQGTYEGNFRDFGSFYRSATGNPTTAVPLPVVWYDAAAAAGSKLKNVPQVGDFDRTLLWVSLLTNVDTGETVFFGNLPEVFGYGEIVGMVYDLKITSVTFLDSNGNPLADQTDTDSTYALRVALGNTPRYDAAGYTGRMDLWFDLGQDFNEVNPSAPSTWVAVADPGAFATPDDWSLDGNHDEFPFVDGKTDATATPILSGTLLPASPGGPLLTLDLWVRTGDQPAGSGASSLGLVKVLAGGLGPPFADFLTPDGSVYNITFENTFTFYPQTKPGGFTGGFDEPPVDNPKTAAVWWDTSSNDPARFTLLPEPGSLALLGIGLVGLAGQLLRRRRK